MKKNIAIISPGKNAYSETFIKAHKDLIKGNIKFYHSGVPPLKLDDKGFIKATLLKELWLKLQVKLKKDLTILSKGRLEHSFKKEKIDIVLAEYGTTAVGILPVCKKLNIPLITHFHGADASVHSVLRDNQQNYRDVFNYSKAVIAVSKVMLDKLRSIGSPTNNIVLNTYGPNKIFNELQPTYSEKKFIGIGRFVDKKAPYYTILAFDKVLKKHPEAKLKLAGDGPLLATCKNLSKHLNIDKNIDFLGIITPEDFKNELLSARAFVQHSITAENGDMEGAPLAVLESSSAGLAVISTIHAGIPDVIINEETGLLVDEHDVDGMAKNMIRVLDDINIARTLGEKGKKRISENFSMKKHISKLEELIYS
jgi:glycosyltransferase involved in cell wall biosynthesis